MKKTLRKIFIKLVNKLGFNIVKTKNDNESLQKILINTFKIHSIDVVIDVGANTGQYGNFLRDLGYKGHIISFEPVKSVFDQLELNAKKDSKWHCYNLALGEKKENKMINVYSSTVFSSFLNATDYGKNIWKSLEVKKDEIVSVLPLDDMISEINKLTNGKNYFLKLDTQGFDHFVFRGSSQIISKLKGMQI